MRITTIIFFILVFWACKKSKDPEVAPEIFPLFYDYRGGIAQSDNSSVLTADKHILICGWASFEYPDNEKWCFFKIAPTGVPIWRKEYNFGPQHGITGIAEAASKEIFICGSVNGLSSLLVKANSSGDTSWTRKSLFGGCGNNAKQIIASKDGNLVICGTFNNCPNAAEDYDLYLTKINTAGDTLWVKTYGRTGKENPYHLLETKNGEYLVTGLSYDNSSTPPTPYLLKVGSNGNKIWDRKIGLGNASTKCKSTVELANGSFVMCGSRLNSGEYWAQVLLIKTDADGNPLWEKTFGNPDLNEEANSIKNNVDGTFVVTGYADTVDYQHNYVLLMKADQEGGQIFFKRYSNKTNRAGWCIIKDENDDNIITGSNLSKPGIFMTRIDNNGHYK